MTRSSNKELVKPYDEPEQVLHSLRKLFKTTSFDHSSSPEFELFSDHEEHVEAEITKTMKEPTMKEYMTKPERIAGSSVLALQVLRRLGSIFTSVYAAVQKLKKAFENKFEGDNTPIVIQPPCYSASKLNAAPVLEVENFTNWKKRFMCHIIGIEPQFENIISNGPYIPMAAGQRKPETQWTPEERKAANLDQRLKSLIMSVLPDDQINSVINCLTAKSTWDDLILYHEGPSDVKESRVMDLKLCYNTFKFKEGESLTQTFTRYKALMNELVNDGIILSKLEINTGFIKSIYETEKSKSLVSATPLSTAFFSSSIVQDFQDSPDDEEDTRSSHEYLNNLEEEYQARALLAKSKRDCWSKTSVPSYQSPFQLKLLLSSENKLEPRQIKDFEAKYHKVKAKLALFSSSASAPSSSSCKNNGLIAETYDWDDEEVSSNENEVMEIKALMTLTDEERVSVGKESSRNGDWTKISMKKKKILGMDQLTEDTFSFESKEIVFVKSSADNSDMPITNNNIHKSSETKDSTLPNQDTDEVPLNESQRNTTNPLVVFSDSSATDYDPADESLVCSTPFLPLKKLNGVKHVSEPKTIKSILKSKSTFKAENLKGITINEPSSTPARGKSSSASKTNSAHAGKLKNVRMEDNPPLAIVLKELNELKLQINKKKSSYSRNKNAQ
ncbi:hypothetical protein Tco_0071360 [Tanacetum coccineum]